MSVRALIFDVDGTLAETEEAHRAAFNAAFRDRGLPWNWSISDYRELLKVTGGKERIRAFQESFPDGAFKIDDDEIRALHGEKTTHYVNILRAGKLELRPGVSELICQARDAGLRIAIATTTSRPNVDVLVECCWQLPAHEVFEIIACGDEVARKKPAGDVYELALDQLGLDPGSAVAFEDSVNGVLSAKAAGLAVVVTPSIYTRDDDFSQADQVVASLTEQDLAAARSLPFHYPDFQLQDH